jgi:hypothetical protein
MKVLSRTQYEFLLRHDLATFAGRCFQDLNPQTCLATNWHLEVIAAKLTEVREGKIRRLIINLPHTIDFIKFIFHPTRYRRPIASLDGSRVERAKGRIPAMNGSPTFREGQARDMAEKVREELITLKSPPPDRAPEITSVAASAR